MRVDMFKSFLKVYLKGGIIQKGVYMSILVKIESEIKDELRILNQYESVDEPDSVLICRKVKGKYRFSLRKKKEKRQKYIPIKEYQKLEKIYRAQLVSDTRKVIQGNVKELESLLKKVADYDPESVAEKLPPAYIKLRETLETIGSKSIIEEMADPKGILQNNKGHKAFPQSENTKDRAGLKFRTSFGLFVRSKNEMLIAEALYAAGLEFWYEKRLELAVRSGSGYNIEAVYPDFTIRLPDGSIVYWEHFGMMDKKDYQEENYRRLQKYLANGIYPPHNMIMTFDGENMPFDNGAVWRIIQGQLLG